jgi:asparagine synthase (glutamine-hydrolysing)
MAHGLETRSPFMDVDLVEFVLSLPASMRFQADDGLKTLLRDSCGDLWPESIKNRKKQGFGAPIQAWLQRPDMQPLLDRVFQRDSPLLELIPNASAVRARSHRSPQTIWNLLCLGLWLERWSVSLSPSLRAA